VVCGANTSYLEDSAWVGDKTPLTLCEVRVSPNNTVKPNIGALELSEALNRVLPFTAKEDNRPVLQCVLFKVKEGKLTIVSADGFRLAVVKVDFEGDDGEVLINREDLRGIANALRHAKRVRVSLEKSGDSLDGMRLILDTELIRYRWQGADGTFPDYEKLIPSQQNTLASFDTTEAIRAVSSLKVLAYAKSYPIDLTIGNGKLIMSNPDDKGQTEIPADTEGEVKVRLDGSYLAEALRACGGMVELKLIDGRSPMLFTVDGYELVVMPMLTSETPKPKTEATEPVASAVAEAEAVAEAKAKAEAPTEKPKRKRSKAKEPVAVA
jgi:DNA polymerase III sliding clamp (beta) subunit (PCNA family)